MDLDAGAGVADIREAYRQHVRTWNPDRPSYDPRVRVATERRLAEVQQAYEWLKANGDAVIRQTTGAGTQPDNGSGESKISHKATNWFLYLVMVGLLMFGIGTIILSNQDAWLGPLVTLNADPATQPDQASR